MCYYSLPRHKGLHLVHSFVHVSNVSLFLDVSFFSLGSCKCLVYLIILDPCPCVTTDGKNHNLISQYCQAYRVQLYEALTSKNLAIRIEKHGLKGLTRKLTCMWALGISLIIRSILNTQKHSRSFQIMASCCQLKVLRDFPIFFS